MILKLGILVGIKHFEHSAGRIPAEIAGHFIYFVKQKHRIVDACAFHSA